MFSKLTDRERKLLYALLIIVILTVGICLLILPAWGRSSKADADLREAETTKKNMQDSIAQMSTTQEEIKSLKTDVTNYTTAYMPSTTTADSVDQAVTQLVTGSGLTPISMLIGEFLPGTYYYYNAGNPLTAQTTDGTTGTTGTQNNTTDTTDNTTTLPQTTTTDNTGTIGATNGASSAATAGMLIPSRVLTGTTGGTTNNDAMGTPGTTDGTTNNMTGTTDAATGTTEGTADNIVGATDGTTGTTGTTDAATGTTEDMQSVTSTAIKCSRITVEATGLMQGLQQLCTTVSQTNGVRLVGFKAQQTEDATGTTITSFTIDFDVLVYGGALSAETQTGMYGDGTSITGNATGAADNTTGTTGATDNTTGTTGATDNTTTGTTNNTTGAVG